MGLYGNLSKRDIKIGSEIANYPASVTVAVQILNKMAAALVM